jgi:hypothetical protein
VWTCGIHEQGYPVPFIYPLFGSGFELVFIVVCACGLHDRGYSVHMGHPLFRRV